jgi:hypothetical protein
MDWEAWKTALGLYVSTPELIGASVVIAVAIFSFAWWLRGHFTKGQTDALEQRLNLAREQHAAVSSQLSDVKVQVAGQDGVISELMKIAHLSPVASVAQLARGNAEIKNTLTSLTNSTANLGATLTFGGGRYQLLVGPFPEITNRST